MIPTGPETNIDCAGETQQQFTRPTVDDDARFEVFTDLGIEVTFCPDMTPYNLLQENQNFG
jgi:hypothetical protein